MQKKLFLFLTAASFQLMAQVQIPQAPKSIDKAAPYTKHLFPEGQAQNTLPMLPSSKKSVLAISTIGETNYDLQSNASVGKRIAYNSSNGEIAAVWTGSSGATPYSDRGSFYNFYDGSTWGAKPSTRIENLRTGWPAMVQTNSSELVISHDFGTFNLIPNIRTTAGSGSWTQGTSIGDASVNPVWPRAAAGGPNGNTVHVIAITAPVASNGAIYKGFDGALLYWKSTDGGNNWVIQDSIIPQIDSADHNGFSADSYSIDASGSTVAIAVFNDFESSFLLKSTDNGDTWTRTEFWTTGLQDYDPTASGTISDVNNDALADTVEGTDNSGEVIIDNNGLVHVFFGRQRYLDDDPILDGVSSYFPLTNGLYYWNENSTAAQIITGALDLDNDGQLNISANTEIAQYFLSLSTFPSAGIDANNNLFLTYSALNELQFSGTQYFNKIYVIASRDGGNTWSTPRELTIALPSLECVYGSLARTVDDKFRLIFQLDGEPGGIVRGDLDPPAPNDIIFFDADTIDNVGLNEFDILKSEVSQLYPNPAHEEVWMQITVKTPGPYSIEVSNMLGVIVNDIHLGNLSSGMKQEVLNTRHLAPGIYTITLRSGLNSSSKQLVIE